MTHMPEQPVDRYHALDDPVQDAVFRLVLNLGAEVWVLKDRLGLLEEALNERGIDVAELIEELSRRPDRGKLITPERDAFLDRFLSGMALGADR